MDPGYLIGGIPTGFDHSSNIGTDPFFIVEADEYDTAFFDKRSKFIHYKPDVLVINNIEFDHVDIFDDVDQIIWQFHQLLRTLSPQSTIIANGDDINIQKLFALGVWSEIDYFSSEAVKDQKWTCILDDNGQNNLCLKGKKLGPIDSKLFGKHNMQNITAAIAALASLGLNPKELIASAQNFIGVKRRLEYVGEFSNIHLFDDFAHHPTAIKLSIDGFKQRSPSNRIVVALVPRSNTMKKGIHKDLLAGSLNNADLVFIYRPKDVDESFDLCFTELGDRVQINNDYDELVKNMRNKLLQGDRVIFMSNGSFGASRQKLTMALQGRR